MVETWTDKDQIDVVRDSTKCLDHFLDYRESTLSKKYKCDNAQLLTYVHEILHKGGYGLGRFLV